MIIHASLFNRPLPDKLKTICLAVNGAEVDSEATSSTSFQLSFWSGILQEVLRAHSQLCKQGSPAMGFRKPYGVCRAPNRVGHIQGKFPACCTESSAPHPPIFEMFRPMPDRQPMWSRLTHVDAKGHVHAV